MTLSDLVDDLKFNSQVQQSEGFNDPVDFVRVITSAGILHNSAYVISDTECTVPEKERFILGLLAWSNFCIIRASHLAIEPTTSQQGFGTDRNTPYYKLMDLSKTLMLQYTSGCQALNLTSFYGSGSVVQSEVTVESIMHNEQSPSELSKEPQKPILSAQAQVSGDGSCIISWFYDDNRNFAEYRIFKLEGSDPIFQEWNFGSTTGTPRINNSATLVGKINTLNCRSVKLLDLNFAPATVNRILVVVASKSSKFSYSNEVVITQT